MKSSVKTLFAVSLLALAAQAGAQVTFYEQDAFQGVRSPPRAASATWGAPASMTAPLRYTVRP